VTTKSWSSSFDLAPIPKIQAWIQDSVAQDQDQDQDSGAQDQDQNQDPDA